MEIPGAPTRLARRLDTSDAVVVGLGSMIGAGAFAAFAPAAAAAGNGLLVGLAIAALVAFCNAISSAQLAARYPESGGAYVYGRERLGPLWGFVAGWGFVVGKTASCAAMALTVGNYAYPAAAKPLAIGAVLALTGVSLLGVKKTALLTKIIVAIVLASLATIVVGTWLAGSPSAAHLTPTLEGATPYGILQSAGILFFAFAGYARIATLGEEVIDPARVIPRAIPIALAITLVVYAALAITSLAAAGANALASSPAPLATVVEAAGLGSLRPLVRAGATVASLGVLLSLLAGVSRTMFAMASRRDLPSVLAAVHEVRRTPRRAELLVAVLVVLVVLVADTRLAIGFSSFAVLTYYAIANAACWTLAPSERRWPRFLAAIGLAGCLALVVTVPWPSLVTGALVLVSGIVLYAVKARVLGAHERTER
ncbi:MAG: APC family permease [Deltaproteobacteria bacterium]|nr:APC family permease [Deltaproteobacteria bacterium]